MIQLLYGIPKAIPFTNLFCDVFDYHYYIPSLNQKLAQLFPLTIIQVSTRTFSYGSALYIHFRDKELLKKIFGVPMMTQYEAWVSNNGRRATKWNLLLSVLGGWYFPRNLDCVLDALEQTWTNQGHHGSVFWGGLAFSHLTRQAMKEILLAGDTNRLVAELTFVSWRFLAVDESEAESVRNFHWRLPLSLKDLRPLRKPPRKCSYNLHEINYRYTNLI